MHKLVPLIKKVILNSFPDVIEVVTRIGALYFHALGKR
jgi:hypothetical protein